MVKFIVGTETLEVCVCLCGHEVFILYCTYQDLRDSKILILPSGKHLQQYKNIVHQDHSGPQTDVLGWMFESAKDA